LNITKRYQTVKGVGLGVWISAQRRVYQGGIPGKSLTEEQVRKLNAIGMIWQVNRSEKACGNVSVQETGFHAFYPPDASGAPQSVSTQ
jgi:hypothetical protein